MSKKSALIVIDVQNDVVNTAVKLPEVLDNICTLLDKAREAGTPVIYVQHQDPYLEPGTPGWEFHPAIAPQEGEPVVAKKACDSFYNTTFQKELDEFMIDHLIVVGAQTDYCIDTTARRAITCGYDVTLVSDAHTTEDNEVLKGEQIIAYHNYTLNGFRADTHTITVKPTSEIAFSAEK